MKALGATLMAADVCSLAAVGAAVFGLASRIFGRDFLDGAYSQFAAFVFGVALIASGAVFRRFDHIMQVALDLLKSDKGIPVEMFLSVRIASELGPFRRFEVKARQENVPNNN
jgi:hypothetical protein